MSTMMMWSLKAQPVLVGKGKLVKDVKVEGCSEYTWMMHFSTSLRIGVSCI